MSSESSHCVTTAGSSLSPAAQRADLTELVDIGGEGFLDDEPLEAEFGEAGERFGPILRRRAEVYHGAVRVQSLRGRACGVDGGHAGSGRALVWVGVAGDDGTGAEEFARGGSRFCQDR
ncbi:hypothetical protein [Saccharopolyspora spinosa]|uniref:hypothetical protein n=1 Tax=Saccharopolyspora spinosa TaxID=60894 RepID=UPI00376EC2CF